MVRAVTFEKRATAKVAVPGRIRRAQTSVQGVRRWIMPLAHNARSVRRVQMHPARAGCCLLADLQSVTRSGNVDFSTRRSWAWSLIGAAHLACGLCSNASSASPHYPTIAPLLRAVTPAIVNISVHGRINEQSSDNSSICLSSLNAKSRRQGSELLSTLNAPRSRKAISGKSAILSLRMAIRLVLDKR